MTYQPKPPRPGRSLTEEFLSILLALVLIPWALGWIIGAWILGERWDGKENRS